MSSTTPTIPPEPTNSLNQSPREIKLISHSNLFYWWPVWAFGFFMATWTYLEGNRLAVVPSDARLTVMSDADDGSRQYALKSKGGVTAPMDYAIKRAEVNEPAFPTRVSQRAWLGTLFVIVLLLTIVITNVPLRGLWSFLTIMGIIVISLLITLFHGWDQLFERVANLRIYINLAGYLFISIAVFVIWAVATFIFDRRQYIIFSAGQIRVCEHIGAAEQAYDTMGMQFEKQRDDLFRHYILGFGSGDLIVRLTGARQAEIKMPNVLGIGWKLKPIQQLVSEKATSNA